MPLEEEKLFRFSRSCGATNEYFTEIRDLPQLGPASRACRPSFRPSGRIRAPRMRCLAPGHRGAKDVAARFVLFFSCIPTMERLFLSSMKILISDNLSARGIEVLRAGPPKWTGSTCTRASRSARVTVQDESACVAMCYVPP